MARYDFCPHCGTANNGGDFCANCGAPLTAPDAGSPQDMQTVPIPVLTTPQGYLDQDGRPIDLSQMAQDFPPDEPHRRGISKKTITVIAALVVVLIVVSAVCGWMIWSNRQRGSQLAACQSAVSSVKASESKAKSEYETAEKLSKTSEEKLDDASLLADLANALGSQKPIAADDYVCDASDGTARLRVVGEQARKDLTSQKAWLRSVNKASKLVQASIDKQTAKTRLTKSPKPRPQRNPRRKPRSNRRIQPSKPVNTSMRGIHIPSRLRRTSYGPANPTMATGVSSPATTMTTSPSPYGVPAISMAALLKVRCGNICRIMTSPTMRWATAVSWPLGRRTELSPIFGSLWTTTSSEPWRSRIRHHPRIVATKLWRPWLPR